MIITIFEEMYVNLNQVNIETKHPKIINIQLAILELMNDFSKPKLIAIIHDVESFLQENLFAQPWPMSFYNKTLCMMSNFIPFLGKFASNIHINIIIRTLVELKCMLARTNTSEQHMRYKHFQFNDLKEQSMLLFYCSQYRVPYRGRGLCFGFAMKHILDLLNKNTILNKTITEWQNNTSSSISHGDLYQLLNVNVLLLQEYSVMFLQQDRVQATSTGKLDQQSIEEICAQLLGSSNKNGIILNLSNTADGHAIGLVKTNDNKIILLDANFGCYLLKKPTLVKEWLTSYIQYFGYSILFDELSCLSIDLENDLGIEKQLMVSHHNRINLAKCNIIINKYNDYCKLDCSMMLSEPACKLNNADVLAAFYAEELNKFNEQDYNSYLTASELLKGTHKSYLQKIQIWLNEVRAFIHWSWIALKEYCTKYIKTKTSILEESAGLENITSINNVQSEKLLVTSNKQENDIYDCVNMGNNRSLLFQGLLSLSTSTMITDNIDSDSMLEQQKQILKNPIYWY